MYAFLINWVVNSVVKPYEEMKKLYQRFAEGEAYEELFELDYEWMPAVE